MDLQAILAEVDSWPIEDRIRLVQEVWDRLAAQGVEPGSSEELKALLDRRLAALDAEPNDVLTWDEIASYVRRPR